MARESINKKSAKKTAPTRTSAMMIEKTNTESVPENRHVGGRVVKVHRLTIIIALAILVLGAVLYYGRGLVVAAVVNGQPISRLSVVRDAEKMSGKQALATSIRSVLIEQEARAKNVTVSDKEIETQIKTIETNLSKQGQKLDDTLSMQGMTRGDLRKIVTLDLLVTKLVEKDIKISDKQVNDYMEKNKEFLPKDKKEADLKKDAREQLKKQQLSSRAQAWIANLEKKAKIVKFVDY